LCNMGLMDMAAIEPLMSALAVLLRAGGRFVFSVVHPAFNNPTAVQMGEMEDRKGAVVTMYSVKIVHYMTRVTHAGMAMQGQPVAHPYFHRPIVGLLEPGFRAGLMVDGLEERAFPAEHGGGSTALSWSGNFSEIPAALVVRMRRQ